METVKIWFKKLNEKATAPKYGTPFSAGADLYACLDSAVVIEPGETQFISTGLAMEIPEGCVGLIYARSGLACKKGLAPANKVGVIDSDYRGEIIVALHNHSKQELLVRSGDRIAQMVITPYYYGDFDEAAELEESVRSDGGFGSTGW
ncbi:MAG TPA: dUTP diphosphatase [Lachnospiraceae bacterium]|nr:dUTP diphosphatase [Eubacterium sp.]HAK57797.1 dUTP diphosphatase [Lachnospiraceae bacterium]